MFLEIYRFELRYHLRSALLWLSMGIFFLMAFGAITTDAVVVGGAIGRINRNAPYVIMQTVLVMSLIGMFVVTAFVAGAVLRDYEFRTHETLFSTPLKKLDYLAGRFLGALTASLLVLVAVEFGIAIGSMMPWLDPERVGPFTAMPYLYSLAFMVLPNLLLGSAVLFGLATLTRSMLWTYVGMITLFVGYVIASNLLGNLESESLAAILDPFGFGAFGSVTRYWTVVERNTMVVALEGAFLVNRLVWGAVSLIMLGLTFGLFSFSAKQSKKRKKAAPSLQNEASEVTHVTGELRPRTGVRPFTAGAMWAQFLRQARLETVGVIRSLPFGVLLVIGVLNLIGNSFAMGQLFGTPVYPRTYLLFQLILGGFALFAIIILTVYSGEMVFRERQLRMDEVYDALPVPNWVYWGSKLVALGGIIIAVLGVAVLTAMGIQLTRGYTNLEPFLYLKGIILLVGVPFTLIAVLALFLQVLTNNKHLGFLLMVMYYIAAPVLASMGFNHNLYLYAGAPPSPYSEMNGFGHWITPVIWFYLYWSLFATLLVVAIHLLWVRGKETRFRTRLALARQRFNGATLATATVALIGFIGVGSWIFYNTNVLNAYVTADDARDLQTRYERDYKQYEDIAQPRITAIKTEVDIFPYERAADVRGTYTLRNKTDEPIETVHVTINPQLEITSVTLPGATLETDDGEIGYYIYRLDTPMNPGDELDLEFDLSMRNPGFVNNGSNTRLVHNGTFINSGAFFPHIGYSSGGELGDPNERRKRDLPPVQRLPALEDVDARGSHQLGSEADWVDYEAIVSTASDQIAIAPGYLQREWEEDGRKYFHYKMDAPILAFHSYLSARYEVARDQWNDVEIAVYYQKGHEYNVERMIEASKASFEYYTENFGPYQHRQFRILEFPRYAAFAQSFPNTVPFSEALGFIARLEDPDEIDYVTYVTAHELAHQWWAHQVIGAAVQGAAVMTETMAQYSALMVMEKMYGPEMMQRFLRYELDSYLQGRGGEQIEEVPLMRVEGQPYIYYRKGSLVMYALRDYVGEEALNSAIAKYVADVKFREPPYTTTLEFLDYIEEAVPEDRRQILVDLFENITLYENQAREATWKQRADGKYVVRIAVEAAKYHADGAGTETAVPLDDWIDIGIFGERGDGDPPAGKLLLLEKRHFTELEATVELVVDEEPTQAGIDPFNKLVDRNPDNNLVRASEAEAEGTE